ncbi:Chromate transporter [Candidatus Sulfotelmatobacter sp. SbA7]|jgi:chromate transporter|nr:Chromate transporter [Candidatus Sulfotelmatobacter sp. SbA7]
MRGDLTNRAVPSGRHAPQIQVLQAEPSLGELALVFLKLGTIAFGGPAAHIAMMRDEFVRKRQWITEADFLDRLGAANLIPGPSSTEVAIFIGHAKRGGAGLLVAGCCFIIPAAVMVALIAAAYVRFGSLPQVAGILYAIKAAVIGVIVQALWSLARTATKTRLLAFIGVVAIVLSAAGVAPLAVLAIAGAASGVALWVKRRPAVAPPAIPVSGKLALLVGSAAVAAAPVSLLRLFLSFLKIGSVVFGSGYVLLAFLRAEFIHHLHWLTERQLIDAVAVGQFTPGPVFTTATFIGYLVAGIPGAVVATVGVFVPGFVFVALSGRMLPRIRRSPLAGAILDGVVVGSLALMAVVAWQLGRAAIVDWITLAIMLVSAGLLMRFRINSAWIVGGAAVIGWLVRGGVHVGG